MQFSQPGPAIHVKERVIIYVDMEKQKSPVVCVNQFSSFTQLCPTLCDPMDCSTPGFPVHHQLPERAQTHVHRVGDAIQPSHPWLSPLSTPSCRRRGFNPGLEKSPGGGNGNPLQYPCLGNLMDRRAWWATVCEVARESDTTERLNNNSECGERHSEDSP